MGKLAVVGLTKHFGGVRALEAVSLTVGEGEILGLIGPNGSGKTTLLNVATGIHRPTAGRVLLDGQELTGWAPHRVARRGVARTFQSVRLFRLLTALENVMVSALATGLGRGPAEDRAREVLAEVGLDRAGEAAAGTLSHGDQRRLELARALAAAPQFLLLDEPAAGLNEAESDELLDLVSGIRERREVGILVVDHDMRLIFRLCDRVHVLDAGRTLFEGTPREVRGSPEVAEAYLGERRAGA